MKVDSFIGKYKFAIISVSVLFLTLAYLSTSKHILKNTFSKIKKRSKNIVIGDSQTPFVKNASGKLELLNDTAGEDALWKGGQGLAWLKNAVAKFKGNTDEVNSIVISIGTNGSFNPKDDVDGLIDTIKITFPKAKLIAVKGSWGWSPYNKDITDSQVNTYYDRFKKNGVKVISPAIGKIEPHGNFPIYKQIASAIENEID
jgi:hypothetical protein